MGQKLESSPTLELLDINSSQRKASECGNRVGNEGSEIQRHEVIFPKSSRRNETKLLFSSPSVDGSFHYWLFP